MPDMTPEIAHTCDTNIEWSILDNGYVIRYGKIPCGGHEYTCSCMSFHFSRGPNKTCKHLKAHKHERCGWNGSLEPTLMPAKDADGNPCCPICGGPVTAIPVAV